MDTQKQQKGWIILGIVALLLLGFFVYQNSDKFLSYDWRMSLDKESKEPYGIQIIKTVLENSIAQDSFILLDKKIGNSLPENKAGNSNFVFIGEALLLDSNDVERLLAFVENGNTVFISSVTIPDLLMEEVYFNDCDSIYWEDYGTYYDTAVITNFVHPDLHAAEDFAFPYVRQHKIYNTYWQKIDNYLFCESDNYPVIISRNPDSTIVDMAMFPYGEGAFYLQTSPIAFTNFYTTKKNGQQYAEKAFTHLQHGKIYWDDFSNVPSTVGRSRNWSSPDPLTPRKGPLDYILSQPALAWAWYLLLALGLLFLLFRSKRQQRIIPVLPKNRNTSLEFISTISRLHFKGDNHRRIALQKMDLVLAFIRNKYRLSFIETNADFIEELSVVSEIDQALLQKMFLLYTNIKSSEFTTDKTIIELHKLTDYFYKNAR